MKIDEVSTALDLTFLDCARPDIPSLHQSTQEQCTPATLPYKKCINVIPRSPSIYSVLVLGVWNLCHNRYTLQRLNYSSTYQYNTALA